MILEEKYRLTAGRPQMPAPATPLVKDIKTIVGIQPHKYDGVGAWAKDSSAPPCGWTSAIGIAVAVIVVFGFLFGYLGTAVGF